MNFDFNNAKISDALANIAKTFTVKMPDKNSLKRMSTETDKARNKYVLKVKYPKNKISPSDSGATWGIALPPSKLVAVSYDVKFDNTFDFSSHGNTLPGITAGHQKDGSTVSGDYTPNGFDGMSMRYVLRQEGELTDLVYHIHQDYHSGQTYTNNCILKKDTWYNLKSIVKLNDVGQQNGSVQTFVDGKLAIDINGLEFIKADTINIDRFYFSAFFCGQDKKTFAPKQDCWAYFDNFVID